MLTWFAILKAPTSSTHQYYPSYLKVSAAFLTHATQLGKFGWKCTDLEVKQFYVVFFVILPVSISAPVSKQR